jgi:hypothetical protein
LQHQFGAQSSIGTKHVQLGRSEAYSGGHFIEPGGLPVLETRGDFGNYDIAGGKGCETHCDITNPLSLTIVGFAVRTYALHRQEYDL